MLELLVFGIVEHKCSWIRCEYKEFSTSEELNNSISETLKYSYNTMTKSNADNPHVMLWGKLYKKEIIDGIDFETNKEKMPYQFFEDNFITPHITYCSSRIVNINQILYYYRKHTKSIMGQTKFGKWHLDLFKVKQETLGIYKKNDFSQYRIELRALGNTLIITYLILSRRLHNNNINEELRIKTMREVVEVFNKNFINIVLRSKGKAQIKYLVSFSLFRISPVIYNKFFGRYYVKNYHLFGRKSM